MAEFESTMLKYLLGKAQCPNFLNRKLAAAYAKENRVLLALGLKMRKSNCAEKQIDKPFLGQQRRERHRVSLAKAAQKALGKAGCRVILMKSFFDFPYSDNDLDFVALDYNKAENALKKAGFKEEKSRSYLREPKKRFFAKEGNSCFVHLHKAFSWNGVDYLGFESVWKSRSTRKIGGTSFSLPSPSHSFLITAAHSMFENKCLYLADLLNLIYLSKKNPDFKQIKAEALEFNWISALSSFLAQADGLHCTLLGKPLFPKSVSGRRHTRNSKNSLLFPFMLEDTFSSSFRKLALDLAALKLMQFPRQLFSYTAVDFMLQRKARREKKQLEAMQ